MSTTAPVTAVCFDLDDTLFPQAEWLAGAWRAVADRAARDGLDRVALHRALVATAAGGSDRGRIIDRALARVGAADVDVAPLVETFRTYRPRHVAPYPGAEDALRRLTERVPLGLVSDGDPLVQATKLDVLGLAGLFTVVVWSDEQGRTRRKPDPTPFRRAVDLLGRPAAEVVYVGDRPEKDVAGASAAGMRAVRVRTGEWAAQPDDLRCWCSVETVVDACAWLDRALDAPRSAFVTT